jgi:hypothetical protein
MGSSSRVVFGAVPALVNNIYPWATNAADFISYVTPAAGGAAGGLGTINAAGYAGYDASYLVSAPGVATYNLRLANASFTVPSGTGGADTYAVNAIALSANAVNQSLVFADNADILNLTSGGLVMSGNVTGKSIGSSVGNGSLTAGGTAFGLQPLYLTVNQGTTVNINSAIVDNGFGGQTRLIYTPINGVVTSLNAPSGYTGGTVLNGGLSYTGTLDLNVVGADGVNTVAIPAGDLLINGATLRLLGNSQISNSVVPVVNGHQANLNLNNYNQTLAGLVINNDGGGTAPQVTIGTGVLTLTGNVTSSSGNAGSVATVTGTGTGGVAVDLGGATRTFTVNPVTVNGNTTVANVTPTLNVNAPIGSLVDQALVGIVKAGNG